MNVKKLKLSDIEIDGGTQMRAEIDQAAVAEYAERMEEGDHFPPLDVFTDGATYWLAGGFHRFHAASKAGFIDFPCTVHKGVLRDAVLFAVADNQRHGLRRSNADKRRAVEALLGDAEWAKWSDRKIAEHAGVSNNLVSEMRRSLSSDDSEGEGRIYITKHGTVATMKPRKTTEKSIVDADTGEVLDNAAVLKTTVERYDADDDDDTETGYTPPVEHEDRKGRERLAPFKQAKSVLKYIWLDPHDLRKTAQHILDEVGPEICAQLADELIAAKKGHSNG